MRLIVRSLQWASALVFVSGLGAGCFISEVDPEGGTDGSCQVGHEGCPCTSGGMCNTPFICNDNLNICIADTCPVGTETCDCTPKGVCDPGLVCLSDHCVEEGCGPGTEACVCTEGGACDPGLDCLSGLCVDPGSATTGAPADGTGTSTGAADSTSTGAPADGTSTGGGGSSGSGG